MELLRNTAGFWGPSLLADFTLVVQILFFLVLCAGVVAQLQGKYKWHDRLQIPVVVLNIFFIALVMIPTFSSVAGELPGGLVQVPTLVTTIHAILGTIAQGLAIYCLLAGLKILPRKIGVLRYWMWAAFTAWTATIIFGIAVYILFYSGASAADGPVAEHDADLVAEHAEPVATTEQGTEPAAPVAEHAEEPIEVEPTQPPTDLVEEHAEEGLPPAEVPAETSLGQLTFSDGSVHSDKITLQVAGVAPLDSSQVYEGWLQGENAPPFSFGVIPVNGTAIDYSFEDPQGRRMPDLYNAMFISIEPANDTDPNPSGTVAYAGQIPPDVMEHIRHVITAFPGSPDGEGLALNALGEVSRLVQLADLQQQYVAQNDLANLLAHAEAALNVIEGQNGPNYGDLDGDGQISDPSDHFGLLAYGGTVGYLQGSADHARLARETAGASANVVLHAGHVEIAAANAINWAAQIRDLELQILQATNPADAAAEVTQMAALVTQLLEGVDANGDGQVAPVPGEGGVRTMYEHGQLMAAIEIMAAGAAPPVPAEAPATNPTPTPELISEHAEEALAPQDTGALPDVGADQMDAMIDEHVADIAQIVEPAFSGQALQARWQAINPTGAGPGARYGHALAYSAATNQVYLFGGRDGSRIYNDVWVFNPETLTWRQLAVNSAVAPPARFSTVLIVDDGGQNLYIANGHTQSGQSFNDVWRLDLAQENWQELSSAAGSPPDARYGNPGGNIGGNLVMTHGFGGTRYDDTWRFNTGSGKWENVTPSGTLPVKRCLFAATPSSNTLVIHGGCAAPFGDCFLDDTWVLDFNANAWRQVLSDITPVGRQYQSLVADTASPNRVVLFGGQDASRAARADLWLLDLSTGSWQPAEGPDGPSARYQHAAVWLPGRGMLLYGGRDSSPMGDMWLLSF